MGKSYKKRKRSPKDEPEKKQSTATEKRNKWLPRKPILCENDQFEIYYRKQKIVPEVEWPAFMDALKESLPTAFRICYSPKGDSAGLIRIMKNKSLIGSSNGEQSEYQAVCLPWYPRELGWQIELSRKDIRRSEGHFRLHNFLTSETTAGFISRQEVVSMIPPLVLDVKSHHKVLDMCAAPGSKTAQIIEMLHDCETTIPEGLVIANDIDNHRCYLLVHQAKRLNSASIIITNQDATKMPNFKHTDSDGNISYMEFDRVLCDVPCSGDGTLRKNPDIWCKWGSFHANTHHLVQLRIARRGLEMLKVGGLLVYSTCSLNPIENEAVIHSLLVQSKGRVQLVDISRHLPGLITRSGLSQWAVATRDLVFINDFQSKVVKEKLLSSVQRTMLPPSPEDADLFQLHRCLRILPHDQNTGGFFVAVLEKLAAMGSKSSTSLGPEQCSPSLIKPKAGHIPRGFRRAMYKEDPYVFFPPEEPLWEVLSQFFDIKDLGPTCFLTRSLIGKKKNIYFVTPLVRDFITNNLSSSKVINTGVKVFVRSNGAAHKLSESLEKCPFRLSQEGLQSIEPFIGPKRRITMTKRDLLTILEVDSKELPPKFAQMTTTTREELESILQGSCILEYKDDDVIIHIAAYRGFTSVRAYLTLMDRAHYMRILGGDASKFDVNKFEKNSDTPMCIDE